MLLCDGGVEEDGDADLSDDDDDDGAGEDGEDGAIADDEEDEGAGVLEDDGGCVDVDDVDDSRWQPAAPSASAMPNTSESLRFNIGRTSHLV